MSRRLPLRPNLDHLKREAKSLLKAHAGGDAASCLLLRHLHRFADATDDEIISADVSLTDLQYALAMDYGFVSWQALKKNVLDAQSALDSVDDYINRILIDALKSGASDLHFEPLESVYRVRFRRDGVIREIDQAEPEMGPKIAARLKQRAGMDIAENQMSQAGRFPFRVSKKRTIDFRVSTLPVVLGEKITCRIVDSAVAEVGLEQLGYEPEQLAMVKNALTQPKGLVLFAGPMGSGKSVSLYTALSQIDSSNLSISTVEDPVDVLLDGTNQCQVNPAKGMDHASALTSILSNDPDVVMVSDLPDQTTARIVFKAAHTGNLTLSSLPTNSAPETLAYLSRLGISEYYLANTINVIVAQRLARRLCVHCRVPLTVSRESLIDEGCYAADLGESVEIFGPAGCNECEDGYKGRIGIFEVVKVVGKVKEAIEAACNAFEIADACQQEGFPNIMQSGLKKVLDGVTSLEEVRRVTGLQ